MDETLLLLMHTLKGLRLSATEVVDLLSGREIDSPYLRANPIWRQESLAELEKSARHGVRWSRIGASDYPRGWLTLSERPLVFHYIGEPVWQEGPLFGVVGSRTPKSESLMWMQRELGPFLRASGAAVVSGGARGIDQWAHRICMDEGLPTVCVLPSGCLDPYPPESQKFWRRIVDTRGCLVSTFPVFAGMRKHHFPTRNRWIVGLSAAVFVVEANRRSGSALTASLATEEAREVCTLPVFPHAEQGLANLDLLHDGGVMIRAKTDLASLWARARLSPAFLE